MDMSEIIAYLPQINIVSIIVLSILFFKLRSGLKAEIVMPEIESLKDEIKELKIKIEKLEQNDEKIGDKFTEQFNEVKAQVSQTRQEIAEMRGALDLLIEKLVK